METRPLPIFSKTYRNVDGVELKDATARLVSAFRTETGGIRSFPGLASFADLGLGDYGVDGVFWWSHRSCAIAVSNGRTFKIEYDGISVTTTDLTTATLLPDRRVSFATDGTTLYMANGGSIIYTDGTANTEIMGDVDAPTTANDVAYLDTYLLANVANTKRFQFSQVLDASSWDALDFASAIGAPDNLTALKVFEREVFLFGPDSIEIWENDGANPFSRVAGGYIESGCIAPKSILWDEQSIYWLDDHRMFMRMDGRRPVPMSTPFDKIIQGFDDVSDCTSDRIVILGKEFLVWHFPAAELTLLYNKSIQDWSELGYWYPDTNTYQRWLGNCHVYCPDWNVHLVGSRQTSDLFSLDENTYTDNGNPIRWYWQSGHMNHGTSKAKRGEEIRFTLKAGHTTSPTVAPTITVKWKDDNRFERTGREMSLGVQGETDIVRRIFRTGTYRTRQYEMYSADAVEIVVASAEEDFTVLNR